MSLGNEETTADLAGGNLEDTDEPGDFIREGFDDETPCDFKGEDLDTDLDGDADELAADEGDVDEVPDTFLNDIDQGTVGNNAEARTVVDELFMAEVGDTVIGF